MEREASESLGFGLRCGFLGLLHMDVFHTRLQDDFNTPVIATAPMVPYTLVRHELSLCTATVAVSPLTQGGPHRRRSRMARYSRRSDRQTSQLPMK